MTSAVDEPKVRAMAGIPRWMRNSFWYVLLIAVSALVLFPLWMTFVRAVSDPAAYSSGVEVRGVPLMPVQPDWGIFNAAFDQGNLGRAAVQSLVMSVVITGAQVVTVVLAAYAFDLRFPFKRLMFAVFMATMMLPLEVTFIANNQTIRQWGWNDTLQGLVAPFLATAFGTFLIRQGFMSIPKRASGGHVLGRIRPHALPLEVRRSAHQASGGLVRVDLLSYPRGTNTCGRER